MSTKIGKLSILSSFVLFLCFLFAFSPSTYAAALPGNGASLSISSTAVGLSFGGTAGSTYHFYLSLELPIGLSPSNLTFGTPTAARSVTEYDFISYAGNCITVDFFYKANSSSYTWQLVTLDSSFDFTQSTILSYGIVTVDQSSLPTNPIFIYDKVLALRQWTNTSHYLSDVSSTYALESSTMQIKDTDTHYSMNSTNGLAVTSVSDNELMGLTTTSDYFLKSASLSSDGSIATGVGPTVNTYNPLASVQLTGGLRSQTAFDVLTDEWGQYLDRVSTMRWINLTVPAFSQFLPGDYYFPTPFNQNTTVSFGSGYLYTNGMTPTYFTVLIDISARPTSVSASGCDLVSWSYSNSRLVLECKKDNDSSDSTIPLTNISFSLSQLRSNYPLMKIQSVAIGSFSVAQMISNVDSREKENLISRGFSSIQSTLNNLFSGLTNGYNSSTSEDLNAFESESSSFSSQASDYVAAEEALFTTANQYFNPTYFNPDSSSFLELAAAFGVVSGFANDIFNASGQYKFLITFTLTFGLILFILQIRRS